MASTIYVIVLDKDLGFCRLFRDDSIDIPAGEVLCTVQGLRRGYDAMMRLNRERRVIDFYHLCSRTGAKGDPSYRIMKTVAEGWSSMETHVDFKLAKAHLKGLLDERARQRAERARIREEAARERRERDAEAREIMARTGIGTKRIPRFTENDLRYVAWLKETGRFVKQAA
jgi:hypothetical protein